MPSKIGPTIGSLVSEGTRGTRATGSSASANEETKTARQSAVSCSERFIGSPSSSHRHDERTADVMVVAHRDPLLEQEPRGSANERIDVAPDHEDRGVAIRHRLG